MLLGTQRAVDGSWVQLCVVGPGAEPVKVYMEADRNGKQQKGEAGLRKLLRAFRAVVPEGKRVFASKGELHVTRNWRPLARVIPGEVNDKVAYQWKEVALEAAQIKRTVVEAELEAQARERAEDVQWCSWLGGCCESAKGCASVVVERPVARGLLSQASRGEVGQVAADL